MDFCFNEVIILFLILVSQLNRNFHKLKNYQFSQIDKNNIVVTQYSAHEGKLTRAGRMSHRTKTIDVYSNEWLTCMFFSINFI